MGGGIGMGNTCKPMADSFQCTTKPTTIKKKIKKIKKIKEKKRGSLFFAFHIKVVSSAYLRLSIFLPATWEIGRRGTPKLSKE